jgi:hypothetical protein
MKRPTSYPISREVLELTYSRLKEKGLTLELQLFLLILSALKRENRLTFTDLSNSLSIAGIKELSLSFISEERGKYHFLLSVYGEKKIAEALENIGLELIKAEAEVLL